MYKFCRDLLIEKYFLSYFFKWCFRGVYFHTIDLLPHQKNIYRSLPKCCLVWLSFWRYFLKDKTGHILVHVPVAYILPPSDSKSSSFFCYFWWFFLQILFIFIIFRYLKVLWPVFKEVLLPYCGKYIDELKTTLF